jgi:transcriptional regulator with XRE-family HTH domain
MPQANETLKRERQQRGWSQGDLARKIGVDDNVISRWERGRITPSPYYRQKLCELFGKSVQELGFLAEPGALPSEVTKEASSMDISGPAERSSESIGPSEATRARSPSSPSKTFLITEAVPLPHRPHFSSHPLFFICTLLLGMVVAGMIGFLAGSLMPSELSVSASHSPRSLYQRAMRTVPVLTDTLAAQNATSQWDVRPQSCFFQAGAYQMVVSQHNLFAVCFERAQRLCDFAYQVEMTIVSGGGGGLMFHETNAGLGERFRVSADGTYDLVGTLNDALAGGTSSAIQVGYGRTNTLAVIMQSDTINLYINGQPISTTHDPNAHVCGLLGFLAVDFADPAQVQFRHAMAWALPQGF